MCFQLVWEVFVNQNLEKAKRALLLLLLFFFSLPPRPAWWIQTHTPVTEIRVCETAGLHLTSHASQATSSRSFVAVPVHCAVAHPLTFFFFLGVLYKVAHLPSFHSFKSSNSAILTFPVFFGSRSSLSINRFVNFVMRLSVRAEQCRHTNNTTTNII